MTWKWEGAKLPDVIFRSASQSEAVQMTDVFINSRADAMPWLAVVHSPEETRLWIEQVVLQSQSVEVAVINDDVAAWLGVEGDWIEHLYVSPRHQAKGLGTKLVASAAEKAGGQLMLHVFQRNTRARRFYEGLGFVEIEQSDGSQNEENEPDVTYRLLNMRSHHG